MLEKNIVFNSSHPIREKKRKKNKSSEAMKSIRFYYGINMVLLITTSRIIENNNYLCYQ